uniref:Protein Wnt n=1 Tax=Patiria pectinifera TaxID=7594 RepID=A0A193PMD9_PATPE|nr:Wnt1 protein [Patiria pectinifera]
MKLEWLVAFFVLPMASLLAKETTAASSGKWWSIATYPQKSNIVTDTQGTEISLEPQMRPLNKRQRRMVRDNPGILLAISQAVKMAVTECKYQFKNRRWNCPTMMNVQGANSLFGKILNTACRETAFIYAITSAAVTHAVARSCSEGSVETCTCDYKYQRPSEEDWEWGGCSDNIAFGHRFSQKFVDADEKGRDLRFMMNMHNNEVGRLTVSSDMRQECKCHGMSGSCTIKTCWMRLPTFRTVGEFLKDRFDGASRVALRNEGVRDSSNSNNNRPGSERGGRRDRGQQRAPTGTESNFQPYNANHKPAGARDLVYFDDSPDFCVRNEKVGTLGTVGRECNNTSLGVDGCDLMCCGRDYDGSQVRIKERCSCTFHWCCKVKCQECTTVRTVYRCR